MPFISKLEKDYYDYSVMISNYLASGISPSLTLKELLMMGNLNYLGSNSLELLGGAIKSPEKNLSNHPLIKDIMKESKKETAFRMYEQFIAAYMSPFSNGDVDFRLGKVQALKALKSKSIYTDDHGRMYTRSTFAQTYNASSTPATPQLSKKYYYTHLFFPPYAYNGRVDPVNVNSTWVPLNEASPVQSESYNIESFHVNRDLLTYREPGFKAVNDTIEYLQYLFEGITGIVSTYLTEWDLSVYIQEGIIGKPTETETETYIPTISLLYRMKDDNPLLYHDDRAYSYGVINAATSRYSYERVWDVSAYPLSKYWTPRYDNFKEMFTDEMGAIPPSYPDEQPLIEFFKQIKYLDAWNALASGWDNWRLLTYKALYNKPDDGLSEIDAEYFMNPDEPMSASKLMSANTDYINGKEDRRPVLNQAKCTRCWLCVTKCPKGLIKPLPYPSSPPVPPTPGPGGTMMMQLNRGGCDECMKCVEICIPMIALEQPETKRRDDVKNGASILNKLTTNAGSKTGNNYPTTGDWASETGDQIPSYSIPLGAPVRNPPNYGGPHGQDLSPKSIGSMFDKDSVLMRNVPRLTTVNLSSNQLIRDYFSGLNQYFVRPSLRANSQINDKVWRDFQSWINKGHRLDVDNSVPQERPIVSRKSPHSIGDGCLSIPAALHQLKQGIYEVRPYLCAYAKVVDVYIELTRWDWWWVSNRSEWNKPSGSYVHNPIANTTEWQPYSYYGPIYSYTYYTYSNYYSNFGNSYGRSYYGTYRTAHTVYYQYCRQKQYFYETAWKYIHHSEPDVEWTISPFRTYDYTVIPGWGWYVAFWSLVSWFWGVRYRIPGLIESSTIVNRLTTNSSLVQVKSFNGYSVSYTSDEITVIKKMVKNHRGLSNKNGLFFVGPGNDPDFIFRANVSVKEFRREYWRYHSHRSHRGHHHLEWMWFEYIDVQFSDQMENFVGLSTVHDNVNSDIWQGGMHANDATTPNHTHYQYMTNNGTTIRGRGIISSWVGFDPVLPSIPGNEIGFTNRVEARDTRLELVSVPLYKIASYNTGATLTPGGFGQYSLAGAIESYYKAGEMPLRIKKAFFKAFTSGTFFPEKSEEFARVTALWPFRILWAQINHQIAFVNLAEELMPLINMEGIAQIMDEAIDPKIVVTCTGLESDVYKKPDFNPYFREAFTILKSVNEKSMVMDAIATRKNVLTEVKEFFEKDNKISKSVLSWTYNDLIKAYEYVSVVENMLMEKDELVSFLHLYLNVLYEYRKYYIAKRFNKSDGTYYILRHLEVLNLIALKQLSIEDKPGLAELALNKGIYDVVAYDVQNSVKNKMLALTGEVEPLPMDRIENVYIKVEYPPNMTTPEQASAFRREQEALKKAGRNYRELTRTRMTAGKDGYDPRKQWAYKPIDGVYRLTSQEYYKNEGNKQVKQLASLVGTPKDSSKPEIQDFDSCITAYITWADDDTKTPIYRGNLVGVDPELVRKYQNFVDPMNQQAYELICYARQAEDYWQVSLKNATLAFPRVEGFINEVKLEQYDPEESSVPPAAKALAPVYYKQLYPITEDQTSLLPGIEKLPEIQQYLKQVLDGVDALDVNLDDIKLKKV